MMNYLGKQDRVIANLINREKDRLNKNIELIASENFVSPAVLEAAGSILTNKYAEGYPGKRYYSGCEYVDEIEEIAIQRISKLFKCKFANVQAHSGSQANQAIFLGFLKPGDTILSMSLNAGGHLSHGASPNLSGKWFNIINYEVRPDNYLIDYEQIEALAKAHKPKMIIAGFSAYPRFIDFKAFKTIADQVGAYLMVDMAHIAGLIATGAHPDPLPYADFVTSTTHKTLRGPRGGLILTNNEDHAKKINSAIFPGLQGGPLMHIIAAKAVAFQEALSDDFKSYIEDVIINAKTLADTLIKRNYDLVTNGTDTHLILMDLRKNKLTGKAATDILDSLGITCNKNNIPFDSVSPFVTSGLRIGSPACTTRGFKAKEFELIGNLIADVLDMAQSKDSDLKLFDSNKVQEIKNKIALLVAKFPLYTNLM